eukprot:scpid37409/ scgid31464/ Heat shock protein 75 kDa, mitochondrial; TNFR-associated protein 1; Tumor necrosis factor type 1 receptor-associated protein
MSSLRAAASLLARQSSRAGLTVPRRCLSALPVCRVGEPARNNALRREYVRHLSTSIARSDGGTQEGSAAQESVGESDAASVERMQFQAETRQLLDIVAKSLYSDKEVFIREVISNASDALEKLRHNRLTDTVSSSSTEVASADQGEELCIRLTVDEANNTFTIQDNGIGMLRHELIDNLGTIARSGSQAFLKDLKEKGETSANAAQSIIGQFGVGFYSTFMVGDLVTVYTRSYKPGSPGYKWISDGSGSFEVSPDESAAVGSKIIVSLKSDETKFSAESSVKDIVTKYSNFISFPIYVNDKQINTVQPLWMTEGKKITEEEHKEFYQFIAQRSDTPRYSLHFSADAPIMVRSLLYVPDGVNAMFGVQHEGLALYNRRVLIQDKARNVIPEWLRFVKGVVDCEDIPLNLSRELLQDNAIIKKVRSTLTSRIVKFLQRESKRDPDKYDQFFDQCGIFIREGIISQDPGETKDEIARLLRFESSEKAEEQTTNLDEYVERMQEGQKDIYYLCTTGRKLAESSPYYLQLRNKGYEVLFSYDQADDTILSALDNFKGKKVASAESFSDPTADDKKAEDITPGSSDDLRLTKEQCEKLGAFMKATLVNKVDDVKPTGSMADFPVVVTSANISAFRSMKRNFMANQKFGNIPLSELLKPTLQFNPSHPVILQLNVTYQVDQTLAELALKQLFDNALISAGVHDDPRTMLPQLNDLIAQALGVKTTSKSSTSSSSSTSTSDSSASADAKDETLEEITPADVTPDATKPQ